MAVAVTIALKATIVESAVAEEDVYWEIDDNVTHMNKEPSEHEYSTIDDCTDNNLVSDTVSCIVTMWP